MEISKPEMENLYIQLTQFRETIKLYHFQCESYAEHKSSDDTLSTYDDLYDKFFETWQGIDGRLKFNTIDGGNVTITYNSSLSKSDIYVIINYIIDVLTEFTHRSTDLQNIRDELIGCLNKFKYLLTFR